MEMFHWMRLRGHGRASSLLLLAVAALAFTASACGDDSEDDSDPNAAYATVRRYEGVTDPAEAGRRVAAGFVPLISDIPGFIAYFWVDAGNGVMFSTSVFRDRAGAEQSNVTARDWVRENLAPLLPNPPQITAGPVVARKENATTATMYATVRRYEGAIDPPEVARRVREGFLPIISGIDGFVAYYFLDAGAGVMLSTSVFRDQAGALQSNAAAADWVRQNLAPLLPNPPQITAGNVVAHAPVAPSDPCAPSASFEQCRSATNEAACTQSGGTWAQVGRGGLTCQCPTGQGNCPCTDSDQCLARCVSLSTSGDACRQVSSGFCAAQSPFPGCVCTLDRLGANVLCVD